MAGISYKIYFQTRSLFDISPFDAKGNPISFGLHPFGILAENLDYQVTNVASSKAESDQFPDCVKDFGKLEEWQIVDFISNIVESCALSDAEEILEAYLFNQPPGSVQLKPKLIARYLLQLGHADKYDKSVRKCKELRDRFVEPGIKLITLGYESFALTIKNQTEEKAKQAVEALCCGNEILKAHPDIDPYSKSFFIHRDLHFRVKSFLYLEINQKKVSVNTASFDHACNLESDLSKAAVCEKQDGNIYEFAQLEDLRAQILSYLATCVKDERDYSSEAIDVAQKVREIYYSLGQLNSVILADRTLGWAYLAQQNSLPESGNCVDNAVVAMATGLIRSFECTDATLQTKLAANLLRLFHNEDMCNVTVEYYDNSVAEACRNIIECKGRTDNCFVAIIYHYLEGIYSKERLIKLKDDFNKYADTKKYPIFFPIDP